MHKNVRLHEMGADRFAVYDADKDAVLMRGTRKECEVLLEKIHTNNERMVSMWEEHRKGLRGMAGLQAWRYTKGVVPLDFVAKCEAIFAAENEKNTLGAALCVDTQDADAEVKKI